MTCTQMAGLSDEKVGWDVILGFGNDRSYGHFAADFRAKIGGESEAEQVRIMTVDGKVAKNKGRHMGRRDVVEVHQCTTCTRFPLKCMFLQ